MSALLALLLTAATPDLPLGTLPKQELPPKGCAAFLWTTGDTPTLIAMAAAEPAQLRVSLGGPLVDLPLKTQAGQGGYGFAGSTDYATPGTHAALDIKIAPRGDLVKGATIPEGTLRLDRDGQDGVAVPVKGIIGCN